MFLMMLLALLLDWLLGEPKRFHPLVGFGLWANCIEKKLNTEQVSRAQGSMALLITIGPISLMVFLMDDYLQSYTVIYPIYCAVVLYFTIGWQSLIQHARAISRPLLAGNIKGARDGLSMIVSRDTATLDEEAISKAATESVLENGADAIFCAFFWFLLLGVNGVVLYRLVNTLDAMWGYKNKRFLYFGFAAAKLDDALNYIPARITAVLYTLCGDTKKAFNCWQQQAPAWKSPNAGPVMAAGAGAINASLGGEAMYHGKLEQRPLLGMTAADGEYSKANARTIDEACRLVSRSLLLFMCVMFLLDVVTQWAMNFI